MNLSELCIRRPVLTTLITASFIVFGIFVFVYLARVLNGTATTADWVILGVAAFLLIITVWRVIISLGKPDA